MRSENAGVLAQELGLFCVVETDVSCGGWQALRILADDSIAEHNMRRALMRRIVAKSVELQLCDLSGACSTQALLDLGPQESYVT